MQLFLSIGLPQDSICELKESCAANDAGWGGTQIIRRNNILVIVWKPRKEPLRLLHPLAYELASHIVESAQAVGTHRRTSRARSCFEQSWEDCADHSAQPIQHFRSSDNGAANPHRLRRSTGEDDADLLVLRHEPVQQTRQYSTACVVDKRTLKQALLLRAPIRLVCVARPTTGRSAARRRSSPTSADWEAAGLLMVGYLLAVSADSTLQERSLFRRLAR